MGNKYHKKNKMANVLKKNGGKKATDMINQIGIDIED